MFETLNGIDTEWFRWVNGHSAPWLDWVMWVLSAHWSWAVVLLIVFLAITMRIEMRRWWWVVIGVALCFLIADQGTVHLFKETFHRLRPCQVLDDVRMFKTRCGGKYGFVSSHAANAFAIVTYLWMRYMRGSAKVTDKVTKWVMIGMVVWAVGTCYSRAYLGKHYPGDLICGAVFGMVVGWIVWIGMKKVEKLFTKFETKA